MSHVYSVVVLYGSMTIALFAAVGTLMLFLLLGKIISHSRLGVFRRFWMPMELFKDHNLTPEGARQVPSFRWWLRATLIAWLLLSAIFLIGVTMKHEEGQQARATGPGAPVHP